MEDKKLTEKESIELITQMIRNTQHRLGRGAGNHFLIWGYATLVTTVAVIIASCIFKNSNVRFIWFLILLLGIIFEWFTKKQRNGVHTYMERIISYTWMIFGSVGFIFSVLSIFWSNVIDIPILFIIVLCMGAATALNGLIINFKPSVAGGVLSVVLSIIMLWMRHTNIEIFLFIIAFVVMMIIPGHILNYKAKQLCSEN